MTQEPRFVFMMGKTLLYERMSTKKAAIALFFILFLAYCYSTAGTGCNPNPRLDLLHSIVEHGTLNIDAYHNNTADKAYYDGHYYSDKAPGTALVALPAFLVAKGLGTFIQPMRQWDTIGWVTTAGSMGVLAALGGVAMFLLLAGFIDRRYAFIATATIFLGGLPFAYTPFLFSHSGTIGLLSLSLYFALRRPIEKHGDITAGLCAGLAVSGEYTAAIAAITIAIVIGIQAPKRLIGFSLGAAGPALFVLVYNWACFGSPFSLGYSYVVGWEGMKNGSFGFSFHTNPFALWALLFSQARGLFFWTPFLLLAIPGFGLLYKKNRPLFLVFLSAILLHILLISSYYTWDGGNALGPRHLSAIIPFLAVPAAFGFRRFPRIGTFLAVVSILLSGTAVLINPGLPYFSKPIADFYWPAFINGRVGWNLGRAVGLSVFGSFLFFFLCIFNGIGFIQWMLKGKRKNRRDK